MMVFLREPMATARPYFTSDRAYVIFVLTYMDGQRQADLLGITLQHYATPEVALSWKLKLEHLILSENRNGESELAMHRLDNLYTRMIKATRR